MFRFTPYCCCGSIPVYLYPCVPECGLIWSGKTTPQTTTIVQNYRNAQRQTIGLNVTDDLDTANECEGGVYFDVQDVGGIYHPTGAYQTVYLENRKPIIPNLVNLGNCWIYGLEYFSGQVVERRLEVRDDGGRYDSENDSPITVLVPTTFVSGTDYIYGANIHFFEEYRLPFNLEQFPFVFDENHTPVALPPLPTGQNRTYYYNSPTDCQITERSKQRTEVWITADQLEATVNSIKSQAQNGMDHLIITNHYLEKHDDSSVRFQSEVLRQEKSINDVTFESSYYGSTIGFFRDSEGNVKSFLDNSGDSYTAGCIKTVNSSSVIPSNWDGDTSDLLGGTPSTLYTKTTKTVNSHPVSESIIEFSDGESMPEKWVINDGNFQYQDDENQLIDHYVGDKYDKDGTLDNRYSGRHIIYSKVVNCDYEGSTSTGHAYTIDFKRYHIALFNVSKNYSDWTNAGSEGQGGGMPLMKTTANLNTTQFHTPRTLLYKHLNEEEIAYPLTNTNLRTHFDADRLFWICPEPYIGFRNDGQYHPMYIGTNSDDPDTRVHQLERQNYWASISLIGQKSGDSANTFRYISRAYLGGDCTGSAMPNTALDVEYEGSNHHVKLISGNEFEKHTIDDVVYSVPTITQDDLDKLFDGDVYATLPTITTLNQYTSVYCLLDLACSMLYITGIDNDDDGGNDGGNEGGGVLQSNGHGVYRPYFTFPELTPAYAYEINSPRGTYYDIKRLCLR